MCAPIQMNSIQVSLSTKWEWENFLLWTKGPVFKIQTENIVLTSICYILDFALNLMLDFVCNPILNFVWNLSAGSQCSVVKLGQNLFYSEKSICTCGRSPLYEFLVDFLSSMTLKIKSGAVIVLDFHSGPNSLLVQ